MYLKKYIPLFFFIFTINIYAGLTKGNLVTSDEPTQVGDLVIVNYSTLSNHHHSNAVIIDTINVDGKIYVVNCQSSNLSFYDAYILDHKNITLNTVNVYSNSNQHLEWLIFYVAQKLIIENNLD